MKDVEGPQGLWPQTPCSQERRRGRVHQRHALQRLSDDLVRQPRRGRRPLSAAVRNSCDDQHRPLPIIHDRIAGDSGSTTTSFKNAEVSRYQTIARLSVRREASRAPRRWIGARPQPRGALRPSGRRAGRLPTPSGRRLVSPTMAGPGWPPAVPSSRRTVAIRTGGPERLPLRSSSRPTTTDALAIHS
jgi:hypothetical protein